LNIINCTRKLLSERLGGDNEKSKQNIRKEREEGARKQGKEEVSEGNKGGKKMKNVKHA
jgi:hypothetical protein